MTTSPETISSASAGSAGAFDPAVPSPAVLRDRLVELAGEVVAGEGLSPPVESALLEDLARTFVRRAGLKDRHVPYAAVLLSNAVWRDALGAVPHDRRLLLLPQCLRDRRRCPARVDAVGLHCAVCGGCLIGQAVTEARRLGMVCLVAEGTPMVMSLLATGKVQAVVGVGCMESLQRVFPAMQSACVPALAVPLLRAGCDRTAVDERMLWETIYLNGTDRPCPADLGRLGQTVAAWFHPDRLADRLAGDDPTSRLARDVLGAGGKRLRPMLAAGTWEALAKSTEPPPALETVALSVECFHKASLVHDDIEDGDAERNGRPALHVGEGLAQAINVGDLLIGQGYRLLAGLDVQAGTRSRLLAVAADAHSRLCIGQGRELDWVRHPRPLGVEDLLVISAGKTAPAFEVALRLGALLTGSDGARSERFDEAVVAFARALGQAYQLRDDLLDAGDVAAGRLTMLAAVGAETAPADLKRTLDRWWRGGRLESAEQNDLSAYLHGEEVRRRAMDLLGAIRRRANEALGRIEPDALRAMLRQLLGRCLADLALPGCCDPDEHL